jgi:hypothetical protein
VPVEDDQSEIMNEMMKPRPSPRAGAETRLWIRSEISENAAGGMNVCKKSSCGRTVSGLNTRPYREISIVMVGNSASVA